MGDCSAIVDDSELGFSSDKINPTSIAREYQLELAKKALDENVIVVLETGCGKTLIAVLLMCDMGHLIKKPQKNVCIFLAPTVVLVHQQARVIEEYTDFKVGVYCGDLKHLKTHGAWDSELEQYEVLVMTPQVLLRSLCHCFIKMEAIALLIFDECHYAQFESNHPYAEIMKVFYDVKVTKVPRIFGMTASPICGKGASINGLQALLHAKVYTVNDKTQLETVVVSPVVQVYHYNSNEKFSSSHQKCLNKLEEIKRQCTSMLCRNGDDPSRLQNAKKLLQRLHNNMAFALTSLGLWGALQACRILLSGDGWERNELIDAKGNSSDEFIQNEYLAQTVSLLETECMGDVAEGMVDTLKLLREPYFSQKVLRLVGILSNFRSRPDMKCIIFVNRIIIARSLAYILGQIKILSAWKCNYLVGVHSKRMSRKTMYQILDEFRSGELNLLVATKVGEEGLDIQTCCLVIRFDLPETLASFIQSRGRARMAQSEYAFLVDSKNEREMNLMDSFRKDEDLMNLDIRDRKPNGVVADINEEVYSVELTGATISSQTSISLLYQYCSKLPHDEYFTPMPDLFNVDDTEGIICHIILPSNAPIHHIVSAPQSSKEAAKKDVCLRACKELHQAGALTDYLLPEHDDISKNDSLDVPDSDSTQDEDSPFKLQEMVVPAALKEPWHVVDNLVCLNSYFIWFKPKPHDRVYKEFGLFVKDPLPCEAEKMNIDLHLAHGRSVLTDLVPSGVAKFNEEELLLALNFQEMCLKIILDRSEFTCDHVPLMKNKNSELNASIFYLMLPVTTQEDSSISVDWSVIRRCLSSPIFAPLGHLSETPPTLNCSLQLANGPASVNDVLNSLVYVGHRNSFFFVSQILTDKNGYSLQNNSTCHVDHFSEKFGIQLAHPGQPLLQAKQLFCLHNLLHDRKTGNFESRELDEYFFKFPPELCEIKIIGFSKDIGSSLSLLPSILHRLENLLVAIELKEKLSKSFVEGAVVTAERVLEALTTEKCLERFSLERLEVLGDAFLKFAVGRHLFLKHEAFDEGQLTRRRSNFISNSNLCKLAIKNHLQGYIRDQAFDSSQFFALGRPCSVICTKQTESVIHCDSEVDLKNGGGGNRQVRCSKNHHWLTKKTIADVVEALVGAYIVDSGFQAAIAFLKWFGIQVEFEASQVCRAWTASSRFMSLADRTRISDIEGILGHHFVRKGLILQALVHPSYNKHGGGCYQRLEFLGDAVLDYLITSYLFSACPDLKPGQLTDLRSSFVNNSSFAQVAASALHKYILYDSNLLHDAINKFVNFIRRHASERHLLEEPPCPKALGDLVESCIGAILLDVGFDLNHLWKVMLTFLDPDRRCSKLQLNPIRELLELSNHHGWIVEFIPSKRNKSFMVEAIVNGKSFRLAASATYRSIKGAKRIAAQQVIEKLKAEGYQLKTKSLDEVLKTLRKREARLIGYDEMPLSLYSSSEWPSAENLTFEDHSNISVNPELTYGNITLNGYPNDSATPKPNVFEMPTIISSSQKKSTRSSLQQEHSQHAGKETFIIDSDGPRKATAKAQLNEICVKNCWKTPLYECCKEEGPSHLRVFTFKVVVVIEDTEGVILECFGKPQAKKKAAAEEAADGALWFLKKEGYIK